MITAIVSNLITEVAPYTGAWIEIGLVAYAMRSAGVAPYTGAWIEMLLKWL